ncbi:MAG TPA: helix-turn-helix transcriptional regulator [Ochrobactrum sp.]|nr:helix-turn-helix transcriptional regulator [Ochrobactrum sp.]
MSSPKTRSALERLGRDLHGARLRRGIAVADLAARAGTSASTIARLEKGDAGIAIGTLANVLVVVGAHRAPLRSGRHPKGRPRISADDRAVASAGTLLCCEASQAEGKRPNSDDGNGCR